MATKNPRLTKLIQAFCEAPGAERNLYDSLKKLLTDAASPSRCDAASVVIDSPIPGTRCAPDLTLYLLGENGRPMVTASRVFASIEVKRGNHLAGGHTSLDTFDQPMELQTTIELDLGQGDGGGARFSGAFGAQIRRRLKAIATAQYDVVVANPPYVRAHTMNRPGF